MLSYFSVQEHAAGKVTSKCQACNGTTFRKVGIGRMLAHFVAGVSGANTCNYVNNVSPNDFTLFRKVVGLSESERTEASTNQNTKKQMSVDEGLTGKPNDDFNLKYARFIPENGLPLTLGQKRTTRELFQKYANKEPPGATVVKQKYEWDKNRLKSDMKKMVPPSREEKTKATLMRDSWTSGRSKRPYVNFLLFVPNHGLFYLGSTDAHGRSQTAEKLVEWGLDWLDEYNVLLDDVSCILADGAAKCNRGAKDMKAGAKHL